MDSVRRTNEIYTKIIMTTCVRHDAQQKKDGTVLSSYDPNISHSPSTNPLINNQNDTPSRNGYAESRTPQSFEVAIRIFQLHSRHHIVSSEREGIVSVVSGVESKTPFLICFRNRPAGESINTDKFP